MSQAAVPSRPRRRLSRDIAGIFGTRAGWSLMGMISGIILARWLGPHDRGILALVLLVPSTVVTIAKLGITQSNVYFINRNKVAPDRVAANCVVLALATSALAIPLVWLLRPWLHETVLRDVPDWALALALARVPLMLLDDYLYGVLQALGKFGLYNRRLLLSEAMRLTMVVVFVLAFGLGLPGAVAIYTVVGTLALAWLIASARKEVRLSLRADYPLLREQLGFGVRSYVQTLAMHLLLRIDVYMVALYLTKPETAFYSLALHLTEIVLEIPQAVGLVLYPRLAALPENEVHQLTAQACRRTLLATAPFAFLLAWLGPYVITLWYGAAYAPAGDPLPWAAAGAMAMALFVILSRDFTSRGRQKVNITAGLLALGSNVALNTYMIPHFGIVGAAQATAIAYTGAGLLLLAAFYAESGMTPREVLLPKREDLAYFADLTRRAVDRGRRLVGLRAVAVR